MIQVLVLASFASGLAAGLGWWAAGRVTALVTTLIEPCLGCEQFSWHGLSSYRQCQACGRKWDRFVGRWWLQ